MNIRRFCICLLISSIGVSCDSELRVHQVCFIGDSIVVRWDLKKYFPDVIVENMGKGAAHLSYLEECSQLDFKNQDVVVLIGTNDLKNVKIEVLDVYFQRYVEAIETISASDIYVYSVFPRDVPTDNDSVNFMIRSFNERVKTHFLNSNRVIYIDVFERLLYEDKLNPQYSFDGVHLNSYGYELISDELRRAMK